MEFSKNEKVLWGILAIWPISLFIIQTIFVITAIANYPEIKDSKFFGIFSSLLSSFSIATGLVYFVVIIYFFILMLKRKIVPEEKRWNWGVFLLVFGVLAFPIFWFYYIFKEDKAETFYKKVI